MDKPTDEVQGRKSTRTLRQRLGLDPLQWRVTLKMMSGLQKAKRDFQITCLNLEGKIKMDIIQLRAKSTTRHQTVSKCLFALAYPNMVSLNVHQPASPPPSFLVGVPREFSLPAAAVDRPPCLTAPYPNYNNLLVVVCLCKPVMLQFT